MRFALACVMLLACRDAPAPTQSPTPTTTQTAQPTATHVAAPKPKGDAACAQSCGPPERAICCDATDKCCAEGVASHFYCYDGPGDCPARP